MSGAPHLLALSVAHLFGGVAAELIPAAGTGPVSCSVVVRPQRSEVVTFPGLRELLAERPGWHLNFDQRDVMVRPRPGDRVTADSAVYQLRTVQADALNTRWLCQGFLVTVDALGTDEFMVPLYFAGTTGLGL